MVPLNGTSMVFQGRFARTGDAEPFGKLTFGSSQSDCDSGV